MTTENKPKLELVEPDKPIDMNDIEALLLDQKLGDGITNVNYHTIPVGKPKDFFRAHPDPNYRRQTWIYTHKLEGVIEETNYIVAEPMRGYTTKLGRAPWSRWCTATDPRGCGRSSSRKRVRKITPRGSRHVQPSKCRSSAGPGWCGSVVPTTPATPKRDTHPIPIGKNCRRSMSF